MTLQYPLREQKWAWQSWRAKGSTAAAEGACEWKSTQTTREARERNLRARDEREQTGEEGGESVVEPEGG